MSRTNCAFGVLLILLLDLSTLWSEGPSTPGSVKVLEQIKAHQQGIALWWTGNAGWLIKADRLLIGIDLDLEAAEKIAIPPVSANDLASLLDLAFVTHHHGDHFNEPTLKGLAQGKQCTFVLPQTCVLRASEIGLDHSQLRICAQYTRETILPSR